MKYSRYLFLLHFFWTALLSAEGCSWTLEATPYDAGFFSIFNTVLGTLDYIERTGQTGLRVDFGKEGFYYDVSKGKNWWEYYFEPIQWGPLPKPQAKITGKQMSEFSFASQFSMSRERGFELIKKYIQIKPFIQNEIDDFFLRNFADHYVIGVHYRGTDKKSVAEMVPYQKVLESVRSVLPEDNYRIYIATDESNFLDFMIAHFGDSVLALDAIRSAGNTAIHSNKGNPPYQLGLEALMDCVLLSKSDILVRTTSNLSNCSMKFNPQVPVINLNYHKKESTFK